MQHFVQDTQMRLDLVTQLYVVTCKEFHYNDHQQGWSSALKSSIWSRFTSLRAVNLVLRNNAYSEQIQSTTLNPCSLDVMIHPPYYCLILPDIVRCFQKLPLIRNRTTVLVAAEYWDDSGPYPHLPITDRRAMAEAVRELFL